MFLPHTNEELIPISDKKPIFIIKEKPNILVKIINGQIEQIENEINLQIKASKLKIAPKILNYFYFEDKMYVLMEKINGITIADKFGYETKDIPIKIWKKIHKIIEKLFKIGIQYIDITPFNFLIDTNNKIYVIDFGHANEIKINWFLKDFFNGINDFNPDFK